MTSGERQDPILYILTGLPFSGKSTLAKQLAEALQIPVLSYDHDIYAHYKDTVPAGTSKAEEFELIQAIAHEHLRALLERGESVIYDDLNLEESDRQKVQAVGQACHVRSVLIYANTPLDVIQQRREASITATGRGGISEGTMQLDISLFQPPRPEEGVWVEPGYEVAEVIEQLRRKIG
jgi:predicted kinase